MRTAIEYRQLLMSLLPKGKAWTRDPDSTLGQFLLALGDEFSRIDSRADDILTESRPTTTIELLEDYENDFSIDPVGSADTRRNRIYSKYLLIGEQFPLYFEEIIRALGWEIKIEEFSPFWCGTSTCGMSCGGQTNIFYWLVYIYAEGHRGAFDSGFDAYSVDSMFSNDVNFINEIIELTKTSYLMTETKRLKPAHTTVLFDFYHKEFDRSFDFSFDSQPVFDDYVYPIEFESAFSEDFTAPRVYTGNYFVGAFDKSFNLSFDSYVGGSFSRDSFDSSFDITI